MTQDTSNRSLSNKRQPRSARHKPTLVTTPEAEASEDQQVEQEAEVIVEETAPAQEAVSRPAALARRLPRFFSTVGKSAQEEEVSEEEVVQARLARATRSKVATKAETTKADAEKETEAPAKSMPARPNAPARPPSPFKTKYIIGMVAYLLGAQLIGGLEVSLFNTYHLDSQLTSFNLFGLQIVIKISTLAFLATLVLLLVLLARLDLIPRSFSALSGQSAQKRGVSPTRQNNSNDVVRTPQPTMRQGVQGSDDNLYQQYQANRRRKK